MCERTKEQIIKQLRKEGYYTTEYAINKMADELFEKDNKQILYMNFSNKDILQHLSVIRRCLKELNDYKLTYCINYLGLGYTEKTSLEDLNNKIKELQEKILRDLKVNL